MRLPLALGSHWLNESWVIPPQANAEFVCQMEEVLQLYTSAYDPDYPLVCFDESSKQLLDKLEFHYTPKHGSWLNMAEIELSVLTRQCLDRRIPKQDMLKEEVTAWEQRRNQIEAKADWQFTNADARIKLKRLYPSISC